MELQTIFSALILGNVGKKGDKQLVHIKSATLTWKSEIKKLKIDLAPNTHK
jgi:hypothetical protein